MPKILLIGGSSDGKWLDLEKLEQKITVPVMGPSAIAGPDGSPIMVVKSNEEYEVLKLRAGEMFIFLFRIQGMTDEEVFKRLILYYRPPHDDHTRQ